MSSGVFRGASLRKVLASIVVNFKFSLPERTSVGGSIIVSRADSKEALWSSSDSLSSPLFSERRAF